MPLGEALLTLDEVLGDSPDVVLVVTPDHEFAYANRAVLRIAHVPEDSAGPDALRIGAPAAFVEAFFAEIDKVVSSGKPRRGEMTLPEMLGSRRFEYTFNPVSSEDGEVIAVACLARDVTEERQLQRRLEDALKRSELLTRVALATSEGLSLEEVSGEILAAVRDSLDLSAGDVAVYDADDEQLRMIAAFGYPEPMIERMSRQSLHDAGLLTIRAIHKRRIMTHEDEELLPEQQPMSGSRYVTMPLFFRGELVGTCDLAFAGRRPFSEDELQLFGVLQTVIARAVENARIIERERRTSETLQEAYMRRPEQVAGIRFSDEYVSAGSVSRIAGDFYDIFALDDEHVAIVMGDVSGKGLKAAALTTVVKTTIRTHLYHGDTPEAAAAKANEMVWRSSEPEIFATAFLGILETPHGRLSYCNAGHPPGLLRRSDGRVEALTATSPVLGAFRGLKWECEYAQLSDGDILLLYTDGVIEARCEGELYGEKRLRSVLAGWEGDVEGLPSEVLEAVRRCAGELRDDAAVLAVCVGRSARA